MVRREYDYWDRSFRVRLIGVVATLRTPTQKRSDTTVLRVGQLPEFVTLSSLRYPGGRLPTSPPYLHGDNWIGLKVVVPTGMSVAATVRRHDYVVVAPARIDEGDSSQRGTPAARGG